MTWQELAALVGNAHWQAASQHVEDVRRYGEGVGVRASVLHKRKVDAAVVEGVSHELLQTPLGGPTELVPRFNGRLNRPHLTAAHIEGALDRIFPRTRAADAVAAVGSLPRAVSRGVAID